jgi:hypothetical protein
MTHLDEPKCVCIRAKCFEGAVDTISRKTKDCVDAQFDQTLNDQVRNLPAIAYSFYLFTNSN